MSDPSKLETKQVTKGGASSIKVIDTDNSRAPVLVARAIQNPSSTAGMTMKRFTSQEFGEADVMSLIDGVTVRAKEVSEGNLDQVEQMLVGQMHALNAIFTELWRRAALNMGQHLPAAETYMRLALKAQSQVRTTALAISEIKFPRQTQFIKQTNLAHNQQVINGDEGNTATNTRAQARPQEIQKLSN